MCVIGIHVQIDRSSLSTYQFSHGRNSYLGKSSRISLQQHGNMSKNDQNGDSILCIFGIVALGHAFPPLLTYTRLGVIEVSICSRHAFRPRHNLELTSGGGHHDTHDNEIINTAENTTIEAPLTLDFSDSQVHDGVGEDLSKTDDIFSIAESY